MDEGKKPGFSGTSWEVVVQGQKKFLGFTNLGLSPAGEKTDSAPGRGHLKLFPLDQAFPAICRGPWIQPGYFVKTGAWIPFLTRPSRNEYGAWDGKSWEEIKEKYPGRRSSLIIL